MMMSALPIELHSGWKMILSIGVSISTLAPWILAYLIFIRTLTPE